MIVYLSGGLESGWQDEVMQGGPHSVEYYDPRKTNLVKPDQYTLWDLTAVQQSTFVFAHMEPDNPSGIGLALARAGLYSVR